MFAHVDIISLLLSVYFLTGRVNGEVFSAIEELEKIAEAENGFMEKMRSFAAELDDFYLNSKLEAFEEEHALIKKDVIGYITNPLNAFLLIKRWTIETDMISQRFPGKSEKLMKAVKKANINYQDLTGAIEGLLRLQKVYRLKTKDLALGIIDGKATRKELTALDLFTIGEEGFKIGGYDHFVKEYLQLALAKIRQGLNIGGEIPFVALQLRLVTAYERVGEYESAINILDDLIPEYPKNTEFVKKKEELLELDREAGDDSVVNEPYHYSDNFERDGKYSEAKEQMLMRRACRGEVTKSPTEQAELKCRYVANTAFSKLAPGKVEELHLEPYLVMFVDVLSDSEIDFLKKVAKPRINRGMVTKNAELVVSIERIAKVGWIYDQEYEIVNRISKRVESLTGLNQRSFEPIQVQNYGIGGHYVPHWDHTIPRQAPLDNEGNRIATMLFYLSDVEKGGETVFPFIKARITPQKGAAAFWYNLKRSGDSEYFTRHAACPVLLGSKWVANKWIREHWQEFRRPCLPENHVEEAEEFYYKEFL